MHSIVGNRRIRLMSIRTYTSPKRIIPGYASRQSTVPSFDPLVPSHVDTSVGGANLEEADPD